jgi:hypothetical protein
MRQGADLADILGIQRAVLGPEHGPEAPEERPPTAGKAGTGGRSTSRPTATRRAG